MKILFIADIMGEPGREIVRKKLHQLKNEVSPDFIIANAENAAGGKGITPVVAKELFLSGVDVITLGNHAFDRKEYIDIIDDERVLRPANYPEGVAGKGWGVYEKDGKKLAVVNLMGRVYLNPIDSPFQKAGEILEKIKTRANCVFVDFHAEITSEKQAMGWFLDGRTTAVVGTHTHIPTADERILPGGTAYLTDAGMTGPSEGVIGMDRDVVIKKYLTGINQQFIVAKGPMVMQGAVIEADQNTGKAVSIKRFSVNGNGN